MDVASVDNMLMNSFGLNDIGNIDVDKYPKGIFSPSPKNEEALPLAQLQKVSSPQKVMSPHVVPHFQHPLGPQQAQQLPRMSPIPQPNFQQPHHHHMQRKVQLGPNFDRLGILNQANEIPPMSAPYFAKALQQHGGSTLGAILQAHQHALQQQMQRESFLLQQAVQQHMFQTAPFNMYHQQRMNSMMMERRADDQIVPNGQMIPPPESWLKHAGRPSPSKRMKLKHDEMELSERRNMSNYKHVSEMNDKYVIFNDETHINQMSEDEDSSPPIVPPKDSVFVRYPVDNYKTLPSFSETFSGHIEKLKQKEQQLKDSLLRHGIPEQMLPESYPSPQIHHEMLPDDMLEAQILQKQFPLQESIPHTNVSHTLPESDIAEHIISVSGAVDQLLPDNDITHQMIPRTEDTKTEQELSDTKNKSCAKDETGVETLLETEPKLENDAIQPAVPEEKYDTLENVINFEGDSTLEDTVKSDENNQLDYLNDVNSIVDNSIVDAELFSQNEPEKTPHRSTPIKQPDAENIKTTNETETFPESEDRETENATNTIDIFRGELDLDTDNPNYDNLFNGNSDEHYFQAFKENNLHLIADLNENKMDGGDDILKLLHSPLDFLNDKFLR